MRKLKAFFAGLTALSCLCASCLPMTEQIQPVCSMIASAEEEEITTSGTCGDNLTWNFEESTGTLTINGTGEMEDWKDYKESPWYDLREDIEKVILEDGITTIGRVSFHSCYALEFVTIPNSVTAIGVGAFYCTPWLETKRNENPLVIINGILIDGITCTDNVVIPDSVTKIGDGAFFLCSLKSIVIPDSVTTIGDEAFNGCDALESITIPDSVASIGDRAFMCCKFLTSIYVDEYNLNYSSQDGILFDKNKSKLIAFPIKNSITEYIIPNSVTTIGEKAFYCCNSLTSVIISDSVTSIGDSAFDRCYALKSVTIPDSVISIGDSAFIKCDALESVTIPDSVISIGDSAFSFCDSLTSIYVDKNNLNYSSKDNILFDKNKSELITFPSKNTIIKYIIPDSVTKIGKYAFYNCTFLISITIENPECEIWDSKYAIPDTAIIYGYNNSTAQAYAEKYNRNFLSLGTAPASATEINFQNFLFFMLSIMRFLT
ncbi:MAG: leucine-rich repeat domain-containing protein [Oscillospiraceae bacterium]|nr:leucine-rich repeat domain-containing protein [Oscillospiraceae bacterium]